MIVGTIKLLGQKLSTRLNRNYINDYGSMKYISTGGKSRLMKQVLNQFKELGIINFDKVWVGSENFAGGNAIRIHTLNSDEKSEGVIRTIGNLFEYGVFNPMIDLYEYKGEKLLFEPNDQYNDLPIEISVKFVSYNNEPPYGTSEYFKLNPPMMKEVA
ncbi:MAG: hypothetical protein HN815_07990 [Candidatus Marinimicrobia bacterium]|jgi:hypothetical protein|nr:hypothetical protein [Candidatus Neomarinimicrobiota bacterium]